MSEKEAYYFSHDSNARNDQRILEMRCVYGSEGYGWFWMLVEMMREQADYKLDMRPKYAFNAFALQLSCDADAAKKFIADCIDEFELFKSDGSFFWSNSLLRRMEKKEEKSEKARASANARWGNKKRNADEMRTHSEGNALKESKVKEIKEKEIVSSCSDSESEKPNIYKTYEQEFGIIGSTTGDLLKALEDEYGAEWVIRAMKEAARQNVRKISYVESTLKNWKVTGLSEPWTLEKPKGDGKHGSIGGDNKNPYPGIDFGF